MMWPSQAKDPWINVRRIDSGNDVTTLHVMNWGGLPLGVEEDEAEQTIDITKKRMKN